MHRIVKEDLVRLTKQVILPIAFFLFLLYPSADPVLAEGHPKELPLLVTLNDLQSEPSQYDGHRIVVTGRVRSIEVQQGRRGGDYVMLVLEDDNAAGASSQFSIRVVSLTLPAVQRGHQALVQGTYHVEGRQAGRPFENFIDAEVILKEKM
ncbi:MAG: hypothetical protein HY282_00120 [Nitrospirae bacterium]|nr:hypothetical protein [Candidatus Manganitrophaceae bacterium]